MKSYSALSTKPHSPESNPLNCTNQVWLYMDLIESSITGCANKRYWQELKKEINALIEIKASST